MSEHAEDCPNDLDRIVAGLGISDPRVADAIRDNIAKAPPLTPEQYDRLALLLRPDVDDWVEDQ